MHKHFPENAPPRPRSFVTSLKTAAKRLLPRPILNLLTYQREVLGLKSAECHPPSFANLRALDAAGVGAILKSREYDAEWAEVKTTLVGLGIWNAPGATGSDDLKPLYLLARGSGATRVLEVGTHIGGSTIALATALKKNAVGTSEPAMVSVDILDVNHPTGGPWVGAGLSASPRDNLESLGLGGIVTFVAGDSLSFLQGCTDGFHFVFLDGDHSARAVYEEIALVSGLLLPHALLTLHDYEPGVVSTSYDDGRSIPGPWMAVRRILAENPGLSVVPPWPLCPARSGAQGRMWPCSPDHSVNTLKIINSVTTELTWC